MGATDFDDVVPVARLLFQCRVQHFESRHQFILNCGTDGDVNCGRKTSFVDCPRFTWSCGLIDFFAAKRSPPLSSMARLAFDVEVFNPDQRKPAPDNARFVLAGAVGTVGAVTEMVTVPESPPESVAVSEQLPPVLRMTLNVWTPEAVANV